MMEDDFESDHPITEPSPSLHEMKHANAHGPCTSPRISNGRLSKIASRTSAMVLVEGK